MAVRFGNEITFKGAVLKIEEHMWMDGMLEVNAVCWNSETQKIERHQVGYYGIDGCNLAGGRAEIDATEKVKHEVRRSLKDSANVAFVKSVLDFKRKISKGTHAEVVRGKKIPKGTKVEVFWVGEKETYRSRGYSWMHETETIAGCYDENGNKLWVKAEYLKNIDPIQSPNATERRKFIKNYIDQAARRLGA